jgi:hypothetical protein
VRHECECLPDHGPTCLEVAVHFKNSMMRGKRTKQGQGEGEGTGGRKVRLNQYIFGFSWLTPRFNLAERKGTLGWVG